MKQETINEAVQVRYNFPLKIATITTILVIIATLAIGYVFMYYLRDLDIIDSAEAKAHINNTTDLWVKVAGVVGFVVIVSVLFYIFKALPKSD